MINREIRIVTILVGFILSACAPFSGEKSLSDGLQSSPEITTAAAASPFLAGLSEAEIQSVKSEAMRVYGRSWKQMAKRSRYVRQPLLKALEKNHAPMALQMIPVVESSYNPYARSEVGATGLWQLMPETATDLHIKSSGQLDGRRDIQSSTRGAARFLLKQYDHFGSWPLAFAAYHLGPSGVQRRINRHPWHNGDGLNKLPLPPITKTYIRHILGLIALQLDGKLSFPPPYPTSTILIHSPVDLERLHTTAGLPRNQIYRFNPKLGRVQYFHNLPKNLSLRISQPRLDRVNDVISATSSDKLSLHLLRGESLKDISKRYHISIYVLKRENPKLAKGSKNGMRLRIPSKNLLRARIATNPLVKPLPKLIAANAGARG